MKLKSIALLIFISFFPPNKSFEFSTKLVVDFLKHFNLNVAIVLYCNQSSELIDAFGSMVRSEFKYFSFFDISSNVFDTNESLLVMKCDYRQLAVIFDVNCNGTKEVFAECSRLNYFNASYNWLMLTDDFESSLSILKPQNINLDAEITLAVNEEGDEVELFDVYNPNSRTNGELVVQPKGSWNESSGIEISLKGTKFERRSNLNGVTLLTGIIAGVHENQTFEQYMESEREI